MFSRLSKTVQAVKLKVAALVTGLVLAAYQRSRFDRIRRISPADITPERIAMALDQASVGQLRELADIYDLMPAMDTAIAGARRQLVSGVLASEWHFTPGDDTPEAARAAAELERDLRRPEVGFPQALEWLIDGGLKGTALVEQIWNPKTQGHRRQLAFSLVPQQRQRINRETGKHELCDSVNDFYGTPIDQFQRGKFISFVPDAPLDPSLWGTYRTLLNVWLRRLNVEGWWSIGLERFGMPVVLATASDPRTVESLEAAMDKFGASAGLVGPPGTTLQGVMSTQAFPHKDFMEWSSASIAKTMLGQTQTSEIAKDTGSKASAKIHKLIQADVLFMIWWMLSRLVERDVAAPWMAMNYPGVATPRLTPMIDQPADLAVTGAAAEIWSRLMPLSEQQLREISGYRAPGPNETPIQTTAPAPAPTPLGNVLPFNASRNAAAGTKRSTPAKPQATPPAFGQAVESGLGDVLDALNELDGDELTLEALAAAIRKIPPGPPKKLVDELQGLRLNGLLAGMKTVTDGRPSPGASA